MKHALQSLAAIGLVLGLSACNTIKGAGEDVEYVGEKTQDAAEKVEDELNED